MTLSYLKVDKPREIQKQTLTEAIQSADELPEKSKKEMLDYLFLLELRDKSKLVETANEFPVKPVEE